MRNTPLKAVFFLMALSATVGSAVALEPEEVAIVVRRDDTMGLRVARYYCDQRKVPRTQIIVVDLPAVEEMPWTAYEQRVQTPVRNYLKRKDLESKIRCLLLIGNLPLKVTPDPATAAEKSELDKLKKYRKQGELEYYQQGWRMEQLSNGQMPGTPPKDIPSKQLKHYWDIDKYYQEMRDRAANAVPALPEKERRQVTPRLKEIQEAVEGLAGVAGKEPDDLIAEDFKERHAAWQKQQEQIEKYRKEIRSLANQRGPVTMRDKRRNLCLQHFGLRAALSQVIDDMNELGSSARSAALDSELALLWDDNYRLHGGQSNPLAGDGIDQKPEPGKTPAALMVARLDGPDPARAIRLIDECKLVERRGKGIVGKLCVDTRGLPTTDTDHRWDQMLLEVADAKGLPEDLTLVKDLSVLAMVGSKANPVALYFGWNDLPKTDQKYQCVSGAIAVCYSDNSAEQIHQSAGGQWANIWLSAGAAAVIGGIDRVHPTYPPKATSLLDALVKDHLTLGEAYWKTVPHTSWQVLLIGDPLYRPWGESK